MPLALLLATAWQLTAEVIYVKHGAIGTGTSWENALGNLNQALDQAKSGDQVWVAQGTFSPTETLDRTISFEIPEGVELYGGFAGTENSLIERNFTLNLTTLTGEIGKPGIADNSFNVVFTKNVTAATIIDGFIIVSGNASGDGQEGARQRSGGAWYNDGSNGSSKPTVRNCVIKNNYGRDGAGMYNFGVAGEASPTLINCTFEENEAGIDGGAIYNNGRNNGASNPVLKNCSFVRNIGTYGGAICNATEEGICNLYLENCSFVENNAFLRGGAVFNMNGKEACYLELLDCVFENNYPDDRSKVTTSKSTLSDAYSLNKP